MTPASSRRRPLSPPSSKRNGAEILLHESAMPSLSKNEGHMNAAELRSRCALGCARIAGSFAWRLPEQSVKIAPAKTDFSKLVHSSAAKEIVNRLRRRARPPIALAQAAEQKPDYQLLVRTKQFSRRLFLAYDPITQDQRLRFSSAYLAESVLGCGVYGVDNRCGHRVCASCRDGEVFKNHRCNARDRSCLANLSRVLFADNHPYFVEELRNEFVDPPCFELSNFISPDGSDCLVGDPLLLRSGAWLARAKSAVGLQ
jgi:hypothetical protein